MKKKIVVLTGAGVSAESGVSTFRDSDGLWENHKVDDVASIEGWYRNPSLVLDFYNKHRPPLYACATQPYRTLSTEWRAPRHTAPTPHRANDAEQLPPRRFAFLAKIS